MDSKIPNHKLQNPNKLQITNAGQNRRHHGTPHEPRAREGRVSFWDRLLMLLGYLIFFPVFNIILTERRKNYTMALHAGQAFLMWISMIAGMVALRAFVFFVLSSEPVPLLDKTVPVFFTVSWIYMAWCGIRSLFTMEFNVPVITPLSKWLA